MERHISNNLPHISDYPTQWAKSPKQFVGVYFDNRAQYFKCRICKNALLQIGDFAHWIEPFDYKAPPIELNDHLYYNPR